MTATPADETIVVDVPDYEPWTLNRAERRAVMAQFGHDYTVLKLYAGERMGGVKRAIREDLQNQEGETIRGEDVFIAILLAIARRDHPDLPDDAFDEIDLWELMKEGERRAKILAEAEKAAEQAAGEGAGAEGKASSTTRSPSKRSTSKKRPGSKS